ncbi:hypothetical protein FA09DRAFT_117368 [Tilletiopsis washingtonensis]|uniref:Uncharacterized protein n=1 Tax=Tilletiopsis washingtonensis TaxID=58919 RepID=A0A316ZIG9_9BASI|nr:hypothetical protein FA09DRAFT_117368 [Tilletiopsis washingtonensis]PWO00879.1 hypothetical protein FA09DRAFT_117368 [Tilletiopsis washingtonensis]
MCWTRGRSSSTSTPERENGRPHTRSRRQRPRRRLARHDSHTSGRTSRLRPARSSSAGRHKCCSCQGLRERRKEGQFPPRRNRTARTSCGRHPGSNQVGAARECDAGYVRGSCAARASAPPLTRPCGPFAATPLRSCAGCMRRGAAGARASLSVSAAATRRDAGAGAAAVSSTACSRKPHLRVPQHAACSTMRSGGGHLLGSASASASASVPGCLHVERCPGRQPSALRCHAAAVRAQTAAVSSAGESSLALPPVPASGSKICPQPSARLRLWCQTPMSGSSPSAAALPLCHGRARTCGCRREKCDTAAADMRPRPACG